MVSDRLNSPLLIFLKMHRAIPDVPAASPRPRNIRPAAPSNCAHEARMTSLEARVDVVEAFFPAALRQRGRRRVTCRSSTISVS